MSTLTRLASVTGAAAIAAVAFTAVPASAITSKGHEDGPGHVVFVQNDNLAGNQIVAYDRSSSGALSHAGTYETGGLGGKLDGSVVDHLASQGSLTYDRRHRELYAVNAGSNSVSVFAVDGDRLSLRQVVSSRGTFPVSITVHDDAVYVLNALNGGSIQGYVNAHGRLIPIRGWNRSLGLDPTATPQFTHTPGQVAFSPDGNQLIVTTKASTNAIDVFGIGRSGRPSAAPVVNAAPGAVPFAVTFDRNGHLVVAEAGTNSLVTFRLNSAGTLTQLDAVATTQIATCWVEPAGAYLFAGNAGGNGTPGFGSLSGYTSSGAGQLTNLGATVTGPGTVDASATPDGRYLYTQTGANGAVDEFAVSATGSLTEIGSVSVPNAVGGEGIVAL
jgi:6-phosphogluconolactonase (cycloisomerase 2 family)